MTTNPKDAAAAAENRVPLHLIPPPAAIHVARALADGASKYGPYNWRETPIQATNYIAAAQRHLAAYLDGEDRDPSGHLHVAHAAAGLMILLDALEHGQVFDDRPKALPNGRAGSMLREKPPA